MWKACEGALEGEESQQVYMLKIDLSYIKRATFGNSHHTILTDGILIK